MKILVITNNYPKKDALKSGIFIHQQVKALQQLGVECYVLMVHNWFPPMGMHSLHTYWQQGHELKQNLFEQYEGVKIFHVPMVVRMPGRFFNDSFFDQASKALVKFIKGNRTLRDADWLYGHFLTDHGYLAARIKDDLGMKLAVIARGDDVHAWPEEDPRLVAHLHYVFEKADLLLANSGNLAKDAQKWMLPGKKKEVSVAYNGIDYHKFRPATTQNEKEELALKFNLPKGKKYMVCIATPVVLKGWIELLEAIKECGGKFDGWVLLMVAPPRNNKDAIDLQQKANELSITDKVSYMGGITPDKLPELLRAVDAFILPSYNEGMSNALLEAMASGLPCITTRVGGHSEVIENESQGVLIAPRSVPEIVGGILKVMQSEETRKSMGANARKKMIAFGDYPANAKKLLALFNNAGKQ